MTFTFLAYVGTMESAEIQEYLSGPALEIEVHDRDRIPEKQKLKATLFGDDLEDEKISNVGTVSSEYSQGWGFTSVLYQVRLTLIATGYHRLDFNPWPHLVNMDWNLD